MFGKKQMTPLGKGGARTVHKGKGSQQAPMPDRGQIGQLARGPMTSINDYAKATPMAQPEAPTEGGF
jgi:hypothetical protein